jgi:hypothetical protein
MPCHRIAPSIARANAGMNVEDQQEKGFLRVSRPPTAHSLPRGHSITSSVRARSEMGESRFSALAVFRLINSSNLAACCTGRSPGFSPLKDAIDIRRGAPVEVNIVSAVGCKSTPDWVVTVGINVRQAVPRCQRRRMPKTELAQARSYRDATAAIHKSDYAAGWRATSIILKIKTNGPRHYRVCF